MKRKIREEIWKKIEENNVALFPGAWGRIPNFKGVESTVQTLRKLEIYRKAEVVSVNPDSPQRLIREALLKDGKQVIMGTPGLKQGFIVLGNLVGREREASTLRGAMRYGRKIGWKLPNIDLKIVGSVAVSKTGGRIGKGQGYFDIGFSILRELNFIDEKTPVLTNVHPLQIVDCIPMDKNDVPVDYIITLQKVIRTDSKFPKPSSVSWNLITPDILRKYPIFQEIRRKKLG